MGKYISQSVSLEEVEKLDQVVGVVDQEKVITLLSSPYHFFPPPPVLGWFSKTSLKLVQGLHCPVGLNFYGAQSEFQSIQQVVGEFSKRAGLGGRTLGDK